MGDAAAAKGIFCRDTLRVARELLGCLLVRETDHGQLICRITETEAYVGPVDKACHAYHYRRTPRTQTLFAPPARCTSISSMGCITV